MVGERILIVEDELAVARGLQYGLEKNDFDSLWTEKVGQDNLAISVSTISCIKIEYGPTLNVATPPLVRVSGAILSKPGLGVQCLQI